MRDAAGDARRKIRDAGERTTAFAASARNRDELRAAFAEFAKNRLAGAPDRVLRFVEGVLGDPDEAADALALAGVYQHLLQEGLAVVDKSFAGLPTLVEGPLTDPIRDLAERFLPDPAERQGLLDERLDAFRARRESLPEPGPLVQRILESELPGVERLSSIRLDGLPDSGRFGFLLDRARQVADLLGRPRDVDELELDLAAIEELVGELVPLTQPLLAELGGRLADFAGRVQQALREILTAEVEIEGVSEAYAFLTATRERPRGRRLSLLGALCFAISYQIVRDLRRRGQPSPLTPAVRARATGLDLASRAPDAGSLRNLVEEAFANPLRKETTASSGDEAEPVLGDTEDFETLVVLWDHQLKHAIALVNSGESKENQKTVGLALNGLGQVTSLLRGPLLDTINAVGFVAAKRRGQTLTAGTIAGFVATYFGWLAWLYGVVLYGIEIAVERFERQVSPFVISLLGLTAMYANLGTFLARIVQIGIVGERPGAAVANLTLGYLEDQVGTMPDALELLKSDTATGATSGVSTAAELVLERVLPWVELLILSVAIPVGSVLDE